MRLRRSKGGGGGDRLTLYYASDVHGSELCWRKFLGAGRFYDAGASIMGGDLTGKAIVPIEALADGTHRARFLGDVRLAGDEGELAELVDAIRFNGMYPWIATADEIERHGADAADQDELFHRLMVAEVARWMDIADERLAEQGRPLYVMAGNDDPWEVDEALDGRQIVHPCDDRVVAVGAHEMISLSYANHTPWDSPRELDEDALYERIKRLADQLERPGTAIFNLHVPPHDSGLDTAIEIDPTDFSPVLHSGVPREIPVGSTAVRQAIEDYQPLVSVHGHIHESKGEARIGTTLAVNPGSEYNSGRIHGSLLVLEPERVASHQFVIG